MKKKAVEYSLKAQKQEFPIVKVVSPKDAVSFARQFYHEDISIYESSFIMLLNQAQNVTGYAKISQGGVCSTLVDVRLVAKYAIDSLAAGVIFIHNHPSGCFKPSIYDERISKQIKDGLSIFGIKLMDSIIISEESYISMNDEGML